MPRDPSGNYTKPLPPVVTGDIIEASYENTNTDDQALALTESLSREGKGGMLSPFKAVDGTAIAPGITFNNETSSGIYRAAAGDVRVAITGADIFRYTSAGPQVWNGSAWIDVTNAETLSAALADYLPLAGGTVAGPLTVTGAFTSPGIDDNAASTAVTIDSAGNVGIGTNSPQQGLHLETAQPTLLITSPIQTYGIGFAYNPADNTWSEQSRRRSDGTFTALATKHAINSTTGAIDYLSWYTATNFERMRIDSSGNVGIGTTSPSALLDVNGDARIHGLTVGRGPGDDPTNTAVGFNAFTTNTIGSQNTAIGHQALSFNTEGGFNIAIGVNALFSNTTGDYNTAVGHLALSSNTIGGFNTAIGRSALQLNSTGTENTAVGNSALINNTEGSYNTSNGSAALFSNTTGDYNTANGYVALRNNTEGSFNTANGYNALNANTTGSQNTAIGHGALLQTTTGSGNFGASFVNSAGGYAPVFNPTTESNRVVMGHTGVTNAYIQVPWTVVSDARDKTQIAPLDKGLDFIEQLNPVSFKFRADRGSEEANGGKRYGFLAQEVLEVEGVDNVIVDTEDPEKLKMTNEELIPILVNAIQELNAKLIAV